MTRTNVLQKANDGFRKIQQSAKLKFDEELDQISLKQNQIETQSLQELKHSLEKINDAINNPENFVQLNIAIDSKSGQPYFTQDTKKAICQMTIIPTLIERKKLILDRIRLLGNSEKKVDDLQEFIKQYDGVIKVQTQQLEKYYNEKMYLAKELAQIHNKFQLSLLKTFLERESAATIIGIILLIIIVLAHVVSLAFTLSIPEILNSAFLIILGYFFGKSGDRD